MSSEIDVTDTLDVTGLNCPMPVIETKQAVDGLAEGGVLEVLATDPGSMSDIAGWAAVTDGVELVDQYDEGEVYRHLIRKAG